jgi:Big-like domain-containing protein
MTRRVRTILSLVAALGLTAAAGSVGSVAEARSGAAPVTAPDTVATYPGNLATIRPLRNDSDPEGDKLTICGLGPEKYPGIRVDVYEDLKDYYIQVRRKAAPGTYTLTYYACDGTSATAGTVTLTVLKPPRITVRKVPGRPGQLRFTNGASFRIRILYGDYTKDDAEGDLKMPKKSSVVVTTRYTRIDWFAFAARSGEALRSGHVHGIRQPRAS